MSMIAPALVRDAGIAEALGGPYDLLVDLVRTYVTLGLTAALSYVFLLRAALIPSRALRTLLLTALIGYPAVVFMATGMCTIVSAVIYGLRREVRQAMQLGQYRLEGSLGEGGMGVVYRVHHAQLKRPTAIKLLPPERAGATALARFEREVKLTARLTHPNTVTIFDYGHTPEGVFYYAMELLDGVKKTLARFDGNVSRAAEALGLSRSALYRRMQSYGL